MARYPTVQIPCAICGALSKKRQRDIDNNKSGKFFCSSKCNGIDKRKEVPCVICSNPILSRRQSKTCSSQCKKKFDSDPNRKHSIGRNAGEAKKTNTRSFKKRFSSVRGVVCEICCYDKYDNLIIHHIVERHLGGSNDFSNLQLLCPNCHGEIHRKIEGPALESQAIC